MSSITATNPVTASGAAPGADQPVVFLNGRFVPAGEAKLNIFDAGLVQGASLADMTRTFNHEPFKLEQHVARLYRALKYAGIRPSVTPEEMVQRSRELIAHNRQLIAAEDELAIVQFVTAGELTLYAGGAAAPSGMTPTVCIHSFPLPFSLWRHLFTQGAHVVTPAVRHIPPQCLDPRTKNRSRLHWFVADQQARLVDPRAMSLLLDLDGHITESGGANFVIVNGSIIVSPLAHNILDGISLQTVQELAAELGMTFTRRNLEVYDVVNADEAWLTTTPYCLAPVTRINGTPIGIGAPGPQFARLLEAWSKRVGKDIRKQVMESALSVADVSGSFAIVTPDHGGAHANLVLVFSDQRRDRAMGYLARGRC